MKRQLYILNGVGSGLIDYLNPNEDIKLIFDNIEKELVTRFSFNTLGPNIANVVFYRNDHQLTESMLSGLINPDLASIDIGINRSWGDLNTIMLYGSCTLDDNTGAVPVTVNFSASDNRNLVINRGINNSSFILIEIRQTI